MTLSNKNQSLIEKIENPEALRELSETQLPQLADEIRAFIIDSVSKTGGHLASSLGTVELTVALHYVFNTPDDRLIWDVGHQTYAHKILTSRRNKMATLRQLNGLSGFTKRSESEFDPFGTGHSSTSISAALGMAIASSLTNSDRKSVAIIGDGAITAGMAYEALSHAGDVNCDMLVILNDNEMSISPNVGGMSKYLAKLLSGKFYSTVRESGKKVLSSMPGVQEFARRAEEHVKGMVIPGTLFEELGFNYIGPIDGHDIPLLISTLRNLKQHKGPQFLHIVTKKGRGYQPAENNPCTFHGVPPFNADNGKLKKTTSTKPSYTQIFGEWLCDMAKLDDTMVAITPAMREGSGMVEFSQRYPDRFFDVSIAEQHAVTLAAGMACEGIRPVVAIYSTFLQRGYDQLIHDVALQNLPVMFAIDRAGIVGSDGATHAGAYDISFLRCIPNMVIMAPSDENECRKMLYTGIKHNGPSAIRYPRGTGTGIPTTPEMSALPIGKAEVRRKGNRVAILAFGSTLNDALIAAEKLDATVINMRFIKPLDIRLINQLAQTHELLVTIEDNTIQGGAGSAVGETLSELGLCPSLLHLGIPDIVTEHGPRDTLLHNYGLDGQGIIAAIRAHSGQITCQKHALELNSY